MEQLTVVDALDERDYLRKKITSLINDSVFVGAHRIKDTKLDGKDVDIFKKDAQAAYQSITDQLDRYHRIDVAITESNAVTKVKLRSGKEMTVAAAIAMRKALRDDNCMEERLLVVMDAQYSRALRDMQVYKDKADAELTSYKQAKLSSQDKSNTKLTDDQVEVIEKFVADLYGELVDPLDLAHTLLDKKDAHQRLEKELDSAIKVSNATTLISF